MSKGKPAAAPVHHPDPYFDEAGHFIHYCWCGKWGSFGVGCFLREGKLGKYYCAEHRPVTIRDLTEAGSHGDSSTKDPS
jgi:hypothetical protein